MLLAIEAHVVSARSVFCFLPHIGTSEVIQVLGPPLLVGFPILLLATVRSATGLLPLFEPRMGMKQTTTERTPPPWKHTFILASILRRPKQEGRMTSDTSKKKR